MCGICGFTGASKPEILKKMTNCLIHRGPDEEGFYQDQNINLGSRRLSIIDLTTGKQPVHNETQTIWAVWNGEIYNFKELRQELVSKGHVFYTDHSDSEVIVHLYEEYGNSFMLKLNGMFAIALWDKKNQNLMLVRDRMGVKPLFYTEFNGQLVFASEIKSILEYPDYEREANYCAIYHYLTFKNMPSPMSAFKNIYSLRPGEMVVFNKGVLQKKRYWKIDFEKTCFYSESEVQETIYNILEDAVKIRMVSDVPIGAYLSGGVDSSTIVAMMAQNSNRPIKTFSLGYETKLKNKEMDLLYARKVAHYYSTEHYEYIMPTQELISYIDDVIKAFDQPFSGAISTFFLSKLIHKHVKVALSGDGADELFGSYLAHRLAQPMYHFPSLFNKYKNDKLTDEEKKLLAPFENKLDYLEKLYIESDGILEKWRFGVLNYNEQEKRDILSKKFLAEIGNESSYELLSSHFRECTAKDPLNKVLEVDWNTLLPDNALAFVDFLSMAHSVEIRSPFLDYRLVEFVSTLPGSIKIKNGNIKDILKKSVEKILPEGITTRAKEGFVLPVFSWMIDELKDYVYSTLSENNLKKHGFFNQQEINKMLSYYYDDQTNNNLASKIWNLMMFQVWWNNYF